MSSAPLSADDIDRLLPTPDEWNEEQARLEQQLQDRWEYEMTDDRDEAADSTVQL